MRSLDEMRPKIVELTGIKLELGEKVESLEHAVRNRDATILHLETSLEKTQEQRDEADKKLQEALELREQERSTAQDTSSDLQKAYTELQEELETSMTSVLTLEAERSNHHQESVRRMEEIARLTALTRKQAEELSSLREALEELRSAQASISAICEPSDQDAHCILSRTKTRGLFKERRMSSSLFVQRSLLRNQKQSIYRKSRR